jgi:hypothetical protein
MIIVHIIHKVGHWLDAIWKAFVSFTILRTCIKKCLPSLPIKWRLSIVSGGFCCQLLLSTSEKWHSEIFCCWNSEKKDEKKLFLLKGTEEGLKFSRFCLLSEESQVCNSVGIGHHDIILYKYTKKYFTFFL